MMITNLKRQNFISVDKKTVRNSYGEYFFIGEKVRHSDSSIKKETATIIRFEPNIEENKIRVITDKGYCHIDSLIKLI